MVCRRNDFIEFLNIIVCEPSAVVRVRVRERIVRVRIDETAIRIRVVVRATDNTARRNPLPFGYLFSLGGGLNRPPRLRFIDFSFISLSLLN